VFKNPKRFRSALTRGSNPRQCRRTGSSEACNAIRRQAVRGSAEPALGTVGLGVWSSKPWAMHGASCLLHGRALIVHTIIPGSCLITDAMAA
jgi:hypothetical protein